MRQERPHAQCTRWFDILATRFPNLSRAEARTLALWSFAATLTQHIGSTTCAALLARLFDQPFGNFRQRLREFYWGADQKRGSLRQTLDVEACFAPLLRWVLALWSRRPGSDSRGTDRRDTLVLALDATLVRDRLAVLSVSFVFRGSAVPVAWKIMCANAEGAWVTPCCRLFERLADATREIASKKEIASEQAAAVRVLVLTDRGLQSRTIFNAITAQGWHPMMRLVHLGLWREEGQPHWRRLSGLLSGPGRYYLGEGHLFKTDPFGCTLLALWEEGYDEPWLLMTDLTPKQCRSEDQSAACYGLRSWIEQGFRCLKGGAYHYQRTRITDPERAERVWLVMAVSLVWTHALGSAALGSAASAEEWPTAEAPGGLLGLFNVGVRRVLGVHRSGWIELLVAALRGEDLPLPRELVPAPLPALPSDLTWVSNLPGPDPPP